MKYECVCWDKTLEIYDHASRKVLQKGSPRTNEESGVILSCLSYLVDRGKVDAAIFMEVTTGLSEFFLQACKEVTADTQDILEKCDVFRKACDVWQNAFQKSLMGRKGSYEEHQSMYEMINHAMEELRKAPVADLLRTYLLPFVSYLKANKVKAVIALSEYVPSFSRPTTTETVEDVLQVLEFYAKRRQSACQGDPCTATKMLAAIQERHRAMTDILKGLLSFTEAFKHSAGGNTRSGNKVMKRAALSDTVNIIPPILQNGRLKRLRKVCRKVLNRVPQKERPQDEEDEFTSAGPSETMTELICKSALPFFTQVRSFPQRNKVMMYMLHDAPTPITNIMV